MVCDERDSQNERRECSLRQPGELMYRGRAEWECGVEVRRLFNAAG